jgi:predicted 3-demethylubiquinone-9 3-methyltransferase (glyoxalase superfamily)
MTTTKKITPFLWFDNQAEEAANFYTSVFKNSKIANVMRNGEAVMVVDFSLDGQKFNALNGGPHFKINPSISFYVVCETAAETDSVWQKLAEGGKALMPLDKYAWSEKYGWVQDRFGLSWQISLGKLSDVGNQKFTPSLLFSGPQRGKAEEAVRFYTSLFGGSSITGILHYEADEEGPKGMVKHAQFVINNQTFMAMDHGMNESFTFNEAVSFVVNCDTQEEVDYFWEKLTADGGEESMCSWLKDKFGVSWQIVPEALPRLLSDPDPAVAQTAMSAMMQMRKIVIADLQKVNEQV